MSCPDIERDSQLIERHLKNSPCRGLLKVRTRGYILMLQFKTEDTVNINGMDALYNLIIEIVLA
jgi:hypothetical protein